MRRNLKSNQSAGTRPPRQAAPKAAGRGRARAQAKPKAKAKAKARPPHLEGNRKLHTLNPVAYTPTPQL